MKKLTTAIAAMLMVIILSTVAYADSYRIEDMGVSVDIPNDFAVFTRNMAENNPLLTDYGYTASEINQIFLSDNIYINAFSANGDYEIVIKVSSSKRSNLIYDFNEFTNMELYDLRSDYEQSHGSPFTFWNVEKIGQAKYLVYEVVNPGDVSIYTRHAFTTVNGKMLSIAVHTNGGPISDEMRMVQNNIVNSVAFDMILENPNKSVYDKVMGNITEYFSATLLGGILFVILIVLALILRVNRTKNMVAHYNKVSMEAKELKERNEVDPYKSSYSTTNNTVTSRSTVFESTSIGYTQLGEEFKRKDFLMDKENLYINSSNDQQNKKSDYNGNNRSFAQQTNNGMHQQNQNNNQNEKMNGDSNNSTYKNSNMK